MSVHRTRKQREHLKLRQESSSQVSWHGKAQEKSLPVSSQSHQPEKSVQDRYFWVDLRKTAGAVLIASALLFLGWWQLG